MGNYNLFQKNELITNVIKDTLQIKSDRPWLSTSSIYFQAFFYMTMRFGQGVIYDDYKLAGTWDFKVKEFTIRVELDSTNVNFMIFGKYRYESNGNNNPYIVKYNRVWSKNPELFINMSADRSKLSVKQKQLLEKIQTEFCEKYGIDDSWTAEMYKENDMSTKYWDYVDDYNTNLVGDYEEIIEKYGRIYNNSYLRFALKTLQSFLRNMLTSIWVRDVQFNICGWTEGEYDKYENNIKIEYLNPK